MVVFAWGGFEWQQGDLRSGRHCCPFDWHAEPSERERRRAIDGARKRMGVRAKGKVCVGAKRASGRRAEEGQGAKAAGGKIRGTGRAGRE